MTFAKSICLATTAILMMGYGAFSYAQLTEQKSWESPDGGRHDVQYFLSTRLVPKKIDRVSRRVRFFRAREDLTTGNAAVFYYRAGLFWYQRPQENRRKLFSRSPAWFGALRDFPRAEVEKYLGMSKNGELSGAMFEELEKAFACATCEWEFLENRKQTRDEWVTTMLPEVDFINQFARLNFLVGRVAILDRDHDQIERCIQNGFTMALHVGLVPVGHSGLYASRVADHALQLAKEWSEMEGSPNLMNAYQTIPLGFSSLEKNRLKELDMVRRSYPILMQDPEGHRSRADWERLFVESVEMMDRIDSVINESRSIKDLNESRSIRVRMLAARLYPVAKFELLKRGYKAEKVDAMPPEQVIAIQTKFIFDATTKPYERLAQLSGPPRFEFWSRLQKRIRENGMEVAGARGDFPIEFNERIVSSDLIVRRRNRDFISLLIGMEAVKDYVARTGTLPTSLAELDVVLDLDTSSGKSFELEQLDGNIVLKSHGTRYRKYPKMTSTNYYFELNSADLQIEKSRKSSSNTDAKNGGGKQ